MDDFAVRTGLTGKGDSTRRYLWTDAFAVQAFFGLARATREEKYNSLALKLIDKVHRTLGRFREDDKRDGWISGLSEEEGKAHPTIGGLRIGKKKPERAKREAFHEQSEWDKDGQYFHYLTRWMQSLLHAYSETSDNRYALWAAELAEAGGQFIDRTEVLHIYWKMSTDLSRPLVPSMGAHDPLEGAILAKSAKQAVPQKAPELDPVIEAMETMCKGRDWSTTDPLGIGGLLLNVPRALELRETALPPSLLPEKLFNDAIKGLDYYHRQSPWQQPAYNRLAFRECGLSLGLRAVNGLDNPSGLDMQRLEAFMPLAGNMETFWCNPENQKPTTWTNHEDINAVTLAASLISAVYPKAFNITFFILAL